MEWLNDVDLLTRPPPLRDTMLSRYNLVWSRELWQNNVEYSSNKSFSRSNENWRKYYTWNIFAAVSNMSFTHLSPRSRNVGQLTPALFFYKL